MKENIYIRTDMGWQEMDLETPSGITLEYKSNMQGDLGKIEASHSYTFRLPYTQRNRALMDSAEDIRTDASIWTKKASVRYTQNGIDMMRGAEIYLSKATQEGYECVLVWNVCEPLKQMQDEDCSLRELRQRLVEKGYEDDELKIVDGELASAASWGYKLLQYEPSDFDNTKMCLRPIYNAGGIYKGWIPIDSKRGGGTAMFRRFVPKPVMPVKYVLHLVEKAYGIMISLGQDQQGIKPIETPEDIVTMGLLPLCGIELTEKQTRLFGNSWNGTNFGRVIKQWNGDWDGEGCIPFDIMGTSPLSLVTKTKVGLRDKDGDFWKYLENVIHLDTAMKWRIEGQIRVHVVDGVGGFGGNSDLNDEDENIDKDKRMKLYVVNLMTYINDRNVHKSFEHEDAILAEIEYNDYEITRSGRVYTGRDLIFNFDPDRGGTPVEIDISDTKSGFAAHDIAIFVSTVEHISFTSDAAAIIDKFVMTPIFEPNDDGLIDTITCLPDISCFEFVKSLFYLVGAFPVIENGAIVPRYWTDFYSEKALQGYKDWSQYLLLQDSELPTEVALGFGSNNARNNYYLTKADDRKKTEQEKLEEDGYESGVRCFTIEGDVFDKEREVYTFPYYPPYIRNKENKYLPTGGTIKTFDWKTGSRFEDYSICESQPAYAVATEVLVKDTYHTERGDLLSEAEEKNVFSLRVVNPAFESMAYDYMAALLGSHTIKVPMNLPETEMTDIDYTQRIYLRQYNKFFAIVSITRDCDGISEATLLALPHIDNDNDN